MIIAGPHAVPNSVGGAVARSFLHLGMPGHLDNLSSAVLETSVWVLPTGDRANREPLTAKSRKVDHITEVL